MSCVLYRQEAAEVNSICIMDGGCLSRVKSLLLAVLPRAAFRIGTYSHFLKYCSQRRARSVVPRKLAS